MGEMLLNGRLYGASGIRELTQAQYDALPASKLTDGILYCIKDTGIVEGDKYAPVIYSLEEREIGVWTDGKPLYEKTMYLTKTTSSTNWESTTYNVSFSNCVFHSIEGVMWAMTVRRPINFVDNVNNFASTVQISPTELRWITKWTNTSQELYAYVTFRYTKTTDVPGSGTWGTDGVPMVHYDGNEKIIGTWFGETLYEKTIKTAFTASATTLDINFNNSSRDMLVLSFKGIMFASNDGATLLNRNNVVFNDCYQSPTDMFTVSTITGWDYVADGIRITKAGAGTYGTAPIVYLTIQYTKTN